MLYIPSRTARAVVAAVKTAMMRKANSFIVPVEAIVRN
jgi:hypothetical protein